MGWQYVPLKTKFEKVIFGTVGFSVGVPVVLCMVADAYAKTILEWSGFLLQMIALGMAAYEINQLDVKVFNGPGFRARMGWKKHPPIIGQVGIAEERDTVLSLAVSEQPPTEDLAEKVRRLEVDMKRLRRDHETLDQRVSTETNEVRRALGRVRDEFSRQLHSVETRLKEATLGNDLERVYAALILVLVGTVLSTFDKCIGGWF